MHEKNCFKVNPVNRYNAKLFVNAGPHKNGVVTLGRGRNDKVHNRCTVLPPNGTNG